MVFDGEGTLKVEYFRRGGTGGGCLLRVTFRDNSASISFYHDGMVGYFCRPLAISEKKLKIQV